MGEGAEGRQRAVELAYRALGRRERTVAEMRSYLEGKGVGAADVEEVVVELQEAGFLDDARYAERFAEDKRQLERWGSERIARDLLRRGVASALVEALTAAQAAGDEMENALGLLAQRVPQPPHDDRGRDRAWRLLVRKGYAPELAYDAVRTHCSRRAA